MCNASNRYLQLYSCAYVSVRSCVLIVVVNTGQNPSNTHVTMSVTRVTHIMLADPDALVRGFSVGKASTLSSEGKVITGFRYYFLSCCFLIACNGGDIFLGSLHPCIPIPSVFQVIPLFLLSPWVMLNTPFPVLIGVASSHLFKVSVL